jgi:tRNA(adenine34) deaminase
VSGEAAGQSAGQAEGLAPRDLHWMQHCIELARLAARQQEVPVGAVVVRGDELIAEGWNRREQDHDPTAHAEIVAITAAARRLGDWRLEGCHLYVSLEPCPMCAGAILQARLPRVVYGALDPKAGGVVSLFRLLDDPRLNHRCQLLGGVLAAECGGLLSDFFRLQRAAGKK